MRSFVTGAGGFIGSNLVDRLLADGHEVVGFDNFSTGQKRFLESALSNRNFKFIEADLLDRAAIENAMDGADIVFHLAANADVRFGPEHTFRDLEQNVIVTYNVLEAMRKCKVKRIGFSSTGSVYGEAPVIPTPEDAPFPVQTSLYGTSKVAAEGLIASYAEAFGFQAYIFRFVSILGERYTHGHVFDFYHQLKSSPGKLTILGNGKQRKSYLYVQDCIDAIFLATTKAAAKVNIFNLGQSEYCEVDFSAKTICKELGLNPEFVYTGGDRGWIGDNPFIFLDCARMRELGWSPKLSIEQAVVRTVQYISQNEWIYDGRK